MIVGILNSLDAVAAHIDNLTKVQTTHIPHCMRLVA